ncbi:uncharacterized protein LOC106671064 [Cimex lectularius]|uniref:Uncharacterized protein n=1 Tax=Cimex lectularius TaxID=79782 RepID=A0A8I6TJW3_CIMLE|nr:uncharacterized protein LOC106671064 [Cimex lectularius]
MAENLRITDHGGSGDFFVNDHLRHPLNLHSEEHYGFRMETILPGVVVYTEDDDGVARLTEGFGRLSLNLGDSEPVTSDDEEPSTSKQENKESATKSEVNEKVSNTLDTSAD